MILFVHLYFVCLQGYNGSQLWDTAFAVQAIVSTKLVEEYGPTLRKAHTYIKKSQVFFPPLKLVSLLLKFKLYI